MMQEYLVLRPSGTCTRVLAPSLAALLQRLGLAETHVRGVYTDLDDCLAQVIPAGAIMDVSCFGGRANTCVF